MRKLLIVVFALLTSAACAQDIPNHSIPIGRGPGAVGWGVAGPCATGQSLVWSGGSGADPTCATGGGGGAVSSVSNSDSTLTFSPTTGAVIGSLNLAHANTWSVTQTFSSVIDSALVSAGTQCVQASSSGLLSGTGTACGAGGAVNSVSNSDGTLTVSPTTGAVVTSLNLGHANTWTVGQTFGAITATGTATFNNIAGASTFCVQVSSSGVLSNTGAACGSGAGAVNSVTNSDGTLTISPTTGSVVASMSAMPADTIKCNNTGLSHAPINCTFVVESITNQFYGNNGAKVNQIADRIELGGAAVFNGASGTDTVTWLHTVGCPNSCDALPFYQMAILDETPGNTGNAGGGLFVGTHACDGAACLSGSQISLFPFAYNNGAGGDAWAMYVEAYRIGNKSATWVCECALINTGNLTIVDPYGLVGGGTQQTINFQIECGNAVYVSTTECSAGIDILNAGSGFAAGIIISANSIVGYNSIFHAIDLPASYQIVWFSASNTEVGELWFGPSGNLNITGTGSQINFNGSAGATCNGINAGTFTSSGGIVTHC